MRDIDIDAMHEAAIAKIRELRNSRENWKLVAIFSLIVNAMLALLANSR